MSIDIGKMEEQAYMRGYEDGRRMLMNRLEQNTCAGCKHYNYETECMMWKVTHIRPYEDYCSRFEPSEFADMR